MSKPAPISFISFRQVSDRVCLGKSAIYKMMRSAAFPRPVNIGTKAVRWDAAEVDAWQRERLAERSAA